MADFIYLASLIATKIKTDGKEVEVGDKRDLALVDASPSST
jgi:hypothetical protein